MGMHGVSRPGVAALRRRALLVGCNYAKSHRPLQGPLNDVWNMYSILSQSLQYNEDQIMILADGSGNGHSSSPSTRAPSKNNIIEGLRWLVRGASPGDNLLLFLSGYGTQQPEHQVEGVYQSYFVPEDFADDLPSDFFLHAAASRGGASVGSGVVCRYRLVSLAEISATVSQLPMGCKITLVLDCNHSVLPGISGVAARSLPFSSARLQLDSCDLAPSTTSGSGGSSLPCSSTRLLDLPPLSTPPYTCAIPAGAPVCVCHCFSSCENQQWCAELLVEGVVQGAFTWAFVKALVTGHFSPSLQHHSEALSMILNDIKCHFRWVSQTPVVQLSSASRTSDRVLL